MDDELLSEVYVRALKACRAKILEDLEVDNITDILYAKEVIGLNEKETISCKTTRNEKCSHLLDILESQTVSAFKCFVESLKAYHGHLADEIESQLWDQTVYLIRSNIQRAKRLASQKIHERSHTTKDSLKEIWQLASQLINLERLDKSTKNETIRCSDEDVSLSGVHIKALSSCQDSLSKSLNVRSMADRWYQENVITREMKDVILSKQTNTSQCITFLELLKMRSTHSFDKFVGALKDTNDTNKQLANEVELYLWEHNLTQTKDNLVLANNLLDQKKYIRSTADLMAIQSHIEQLMEQCNIQDSPQKRENLTLSVKPKFDEEKMVRKSYTMQEFDKEKMVRKRYTMQSTGNVKAMDQTFLSMSSDLQDKLLKEIQETQLKRRYKKADNVGPSSMKINEDDVEHKTDQPVKSKVFQLNSKPPIPPKPLKLTSTEKRGSKIMSPKIKAEEQEKQLKAQVEMRNKKTDSNVLGQEIILPDIKVEGPEKHRQIMEMIKGDEVDRNTLKFSSKQECENAPTNNSIDQHLSVSHLSPSVEKGPEKFDSIQVRKNNLETEQHKFKSNSLNRAEMQACLSIPHPQSETVEFIKSKMEEEKALKRKGNLIDPCCRIKHVKIKDLSDVKTIEYLETRDILLMGRKRASKKRASNTTAIAMICDQNWKCKTTLVAKQVRDVASNKDVIVVSCEEKGSNMLKIFDINGQLKRSLDTPLYTANCITFNHSNELVIKVEGQDNRAIYHMDMSSMRIRNATPTGMFSSQVSTIAVAPNNDILIADYFDNSVKCRDRNGNLLFKYKGEGSQYSFNPSSVCTDDMGHILIADMDNNRIHILSPEHQLIKFISVDGLEAPNMITVNHEGHLVVGTSPSSGSAEVFIVKYRE